MKTIAEAAGWEHDFDDLIFAARNLLRDHDEVRRALGARFTRVLVDEFQDTDPLQTEIFWRLCGEPPAGRATAGAARGLIVLVTTGEIIAVTPSPLAAVAA